MLAIPLTNFQGLKRSKMQTKFIRHQFISTAKQGGVMPSYWSAIETSLNDRLPKTGSGRDTV